MLTSPDRFCNLSNVLTIILSNKLNLVSIIGSDFTQLNEKYVKVIVVNKKDLYKFDRFIDTCLTKSGTYEVKIVEDFSDLSAENVSDEIVENAEDTTTLLEKYIEELDVDIDKKRLTSMMKSLYVEASDLEL